MTATSSVSSNALNFMSSMKNGVDPRTGLYSVSVNLPEVQTNDLRGPGFALALAYSPLNTLDSGYGFGWNLQLSQYTPSTQVLALSTGETFKVTGEANGQLVMREKKLDSFHFYKENELRYRVMHKSGLVEILEMLGSAQNRVALPVEIHSPTGHKVLLAYKPFSGAHWILDWVKDNSGQTLLTVNRESSSVEVLLQPFAGPDGGPLGRFVMTLGASDKYVTRITLPTEEQASWRFEYRLVHDHLCMSAVETPGGGREEMLYQDLGHQFPGNTGRKPLPRVTRHFTLPGFEQPTVEVRYTYPQDKNFLGNGLSIPWTDDGLDNLYKYVGTYEYACVETLWVNDKAVRTIERKFNQFHLLTSEATTQNNNIETVETTYHLTQGVGFDQQPNYCQMPKSVSTIWSLLNNPNMRRSETVSSTYDNFGNLLTQTHASGVVETSTWYPAAGGDGCPHDPEGFVRQMKDQTVTPAPSPNGQAPTLCTRYRYKALPPLAGSPLPNWLTLERQTLVQLAGSNETELERTLFEHTNDPGNAFLHGRVKRQTTTLNEKSTIVDYDYLNLYSRQLNAPVQQTTETLSTDFDDVSRTILRQHSLLTSQELLSRTDGVETLYHYDSLNRLTAEIVAANTQYEARREYQYKLSTTHGQQAEHITINARKVKTRSVLDGLGRVIFQERDNVDSAAPGQTRQTYAAVYDDWGNLFEQTEYDWLDGTRLALTTQFHYDDWAQQSRAIGPDGVEAHQVIDPIGTDESKGPIQRSWAQSSGESPIKSGMSEIWMNLFGKPTRTATLDAENAEIAVETFLYDGLGRCTQHNDSLKNATRYVYDAWSRLISSTLPDDSIVRRTYAPHSAAELAVSLTVSADGIIQIPVGEQTFDGLSRLTQMTCGKRTERFAYEADRMQVKTRTTPANDSIEYGYNLTLTDQPISSQAPDEEASFLYHPTSARLTQARNEQGTREYDYNTANQMLGERWVDQQGKNWETLYSCSMQGRLLKRTEARQAGSEGLNTVDTYDDFGRAKSVRQGQIEVRFEYNSLGQPSKTTTTDLSANSTLVTELTYDDQGRETLRTLQLTGKPPRTQEQTWQPDGLLEVRHLKQNEVTELKETFKYDPRGRLTSHECEGTTLPRDSEGREIKKQIFSFDALDNIKIVLTTFIDGKTERAIFTYATDDPCQLKSIAYTPARPTANPVFTYDLNGCQLNDERGQRLIYDSQSRLVDVEDSASKVVSQYRYDSHDHLVTSKHGNDSETLRFYQDEQLTTTVQEGRQTQLLYHFDQPLGQQLASDPSQTLLLQTDANHSVIAESQQNSLRKAVYSAYGERHTDSPMFSLRAFNGEVREASGWYLLGRGYRAYNPSLMRFHSPDSLSPFGSGGVNPYSYCLGNPIALRDPTGHSAIGWSGRLRRPDEDAVPGRSGGGGDWMSWVGVAVGAIFVAVGVAATIATFGAAGPLTAGIIAKGSLLALGTGLTAGSTAAGAVAAANGDEEAGKWSMYLGYAALAATAPTIIYGAYKGVKSLIKAHINGTSRKSSFSSVGSGFSGGYGGGDVPLAIPRIIIPQSSLSRPVGNASKLRPASNSAGAGTSAVQVATPAAVSTSTPTFASAIHAQNFKLKPAPTPAAKPAGALDELKLTVQGHADGKSLSEALKTAQAQTTESPMLQTAKDKSINSAIKTGAIRF